MTIRSVGVTATRNGLDPIQINGFRDFLYINYPIAFHHGDCVGGDCELATLLHNKIYPDTYIIAHPGDTPRWRANCPVNAFILPERRNLVRDHDIVDASQIMLAFPGTMEEVQRSGTWATIRYAKKIKKPLKIYYPNGVIEEF